MIPEFKNPLILLLIPVLLAAFWVNRRRARSASFQFSSVALVRESGNTWRSQFSFLPWVLRALALVLLVIALAGPREVLEESQVTSEGIDIVLTLDVSGSMATEDFQINGHRSNRVDIIKTVVEDFVRQRKYDRLGLVAFGSRAYTVCPLTSDHNWLLENLRRVRLGVIEDGTAIGSGISSALVRLKNSRAKSKVIILLTDGVNNAGKIDPLTAAKAAQAMGVRIYTVGAGSKGLAPFPVTDMFGRRFYQNIQSDLDEDGLKQIAQLTNGRYFRATDTDSLRQTYHQIDQLEKSKIEEKGYKEYRQLFGHFLAAALVVLAAEIILANTVFLKIP